MSVVELWVEERAGRPAVNDVMALLGDELERRGVRMCARVAEREVIEPDALARGPKPGLVLLKSPTALALSRATADERSGVAFLNAATATLRAHDKAAVVGVLAAHGIPVPETFLVGASPSGTTGLDVASDDGWVVKPVRGVHGRDVSVHERLDDAIAACVERPHESASTAWLVQRRVGSAAHDIKAYVAGDALFAGRKRFGPRSFDSNRISPVTLDEREEELVFAAGAALGLELFGVDLRHDRDGSPVVIDVNPFPGYRGFPQAVRPLAALVEAALSRT